jgi:hypothetical protein
MLTAVVSVTVPQELRFNFGFRDRWEETRHEYKIFVEKDQVMRSLEISGREWEGSITTIL